MQLQASDDDSPSYIGWKYSNGSIRITVEGVGEHIDGETLYSYSPLIGVEVGQSEVLALDESADIVVFKGNFEEQHKCFDAWVLLATENERPAVFLSEGLVALAKLDPAPLPPLPETDEVATRLANDVLAVSRKLSKDATETTRDLS